MNIRYALFPLAVVAASPASAQVMAPAEYVAAAGAGDLYERTSSQLVLATTQNPRVREFATMMIAHHTKSTADVTAAARKARVPVAPPRLNPAQQEMVAQLRAATGPARDASYIAQQKTAHGQSLAIHSAFAADGTAPSLKAAAAAIKPVVQQHIDMLRQI